MSRAGDLRVVYDALGADERSVLLYGIAGALALVGFIASVMLGLLPLGILFGVLVCICGLGFGRGARAAVVSSDD